MPAPHFRLFGIIFAASFTVSAVITAALGAVATLRSRGVCVALLAQLLSLLVMDELDRSGDTLQINHSILPVRVKEEPVSRPAASSSRRQSVSPIPSSPAADSRRFSQERSFQGVSLSKILFGNLDDDSDDANATQSNGGADAAATHAPQAAAERIDHVLLGLSRASHALLSVSTAALRPSAAAAQQFVLTAVHSFTRDDDADTGNPFFGTMRALARALVFARSDDVLTRTRSQVSWSAIRGQPGRSSARTAAQATMRSAAWSPATGGARSATNCLGPSRKVLISCLSNSDSHRCLVASCGIARWAVGGCRVPHAGRERAGHAATLVAGLCFRTRRFTWCVPVRCCVNRCMTSRALISM